METRAGLLLLRIGLGLYLLLWSLSHLAHPDATQGLLERAAHVHASPAAAYAIGVALVALSLAFLAGVWKLGTYSAAAVVQGAASLSAFRGLLHPFDKPPQAFAAIPLLAAFVALLLLRDKDSLGTL
ncbi:MAG: hypothetical protein HY078_02150 [Elusimicrobia bacterium]|nr:hypothetical protein [Elusimicrobiota bacterium]